MIHYGNFAIPYVMIGFVCCAILMLTAIVVVMHLRHEYRPNLIGALIGALLCFLLLEALPALT